MKRCPECRRDYYDDTLLYCLDDGNALLVGPASVDEPATAILHSTAASGEAPTRTSDADREGRKSTARPEDSVSRGLSMRNAVIAGVLGAAVIAVLGFGGYWYFSDGSADSINSIAVLPFENAGGFADSEYLSDGISEALINSLTELQQLRVIARGTAFRYKGKEIDPKAVGNELNVRAVLMGRVRQVGDSLNVQVDLVDTSTGAQLWGREYERKVSDALSIKQAITREVTENLRLRLSGEQQQELTRRDTTNAEAYQSYMRGRFHWNKRTAENISRAIHEFQQAIERDPNYALSYVGLADAYFVQVQYAGVPANETLPKAREAIDKALQIDRSLPEAHVSLAAVHQAQWQWAEAEEEFKRAISLNPNYPTAHHWYATYNMARRRFDISLKEISRAMELDPLSPIIGTSKAFVHLLQENPETAIEECKRVIEIDPNFPSAYHHLGWAYLKQRQYAEATAAFERAVELSGRAGFYLSDLGYGYTVTGRRGDALAVLKELEGKYAGREAYGLHLAGVHVGLGEKDQAFAWLEKDFQQRGGNELPSVTFRFAFDGLRSDPRYADLVRRMGLEP